VLKIAYNRRRKRRKRKRKLRRNRLKKGSVYDVRDWRLRKRQGKALLPPLREMFHLLRLHLPRLQNARPSLLLLVEHQHRLMLPLPRLSLPRLPLRFLCKFLSLCNLRLIQRKRPFVQERKLSKNDMRNGLLGFVS